MTSDIDQPAGTVTKAVIVCQSTMVMVLWLVCVTDVDSIRATQTKLMRSRNSIAGVGACTSAWMNRNRKVITYLKVYAAWMRRATNRLDRQ